MVISGDVDVGKLLELAKMNQTSTSETPIPMSMSYGILRLLRVIHREYFRLQWVFWKCLAIQCTNEFVLPRGTVWWQDWMLFCRSVRISEPSIFSDSVSVQNTYPPMVNTNNYAESQYYQPNESFNDVPSTNFSTLSNDSFKSLLSYIDSSAIIHPFLNKIVWISSRSFYS